MTGLVRAAFGDWAALSLAGQPVTSDVFRGAESSRPAVDGSTTLVPPERQLSTVLSTQLARVTAEKVKTCQVQ